MEGPDGAEDPALGCRVKEERSHGGERSTKMRDWLIELQGALGCIRAAGRSKIGPDRWPWVWPLRSW